MTDFVLQNDKQPYINSSKYQDVLKYAEFLKQPLTLGQFVPCDLAGAILDKPDRDLYKDIDGIYDEFHWELNIKIYNEAKERVLFRNPIVWNNFSEMEALRIENNYFAWKKQGMNSFELNDISKNETIEDLIEYDLELTESALKQIGL